MSYTAGKKCIQSKQCEESAGAIRFDASPAKPHTNAETCAKFALVADLGGETAVRHRGRDRSRGRKDVRHCGKDRSSRQHRNGLQSRAKTQTNMLGGEGADAPQKKEAGTEMNYTARPAMTYGCLAGAVNGQRQVIQ